MQRVIVRVAGLAATAAATACLAAPAAQAYTHQWNCAGGLSAYTQCFDNAGMTYNAWSTIGAGFGATLPSGYNGFCVKAVDSNGNAKGGNTCWGPTHTSEAASFAPSPASLAYYYFGGSGSSYNNTGLATT